MKSYRFLVLGLLVVLVGGGWVSLGRAGSDLREAHAAHLGAARDAVAIGAIQEAQREFRAALALEPDVEVYDELLTFLATDAPRDVYVAELASYVGAFPDRAEGYERLASAYADGDDEARAYETVLRARSRGLGSPTLDALYARVAFMYKVGTQHYDDVLPYGRDDVAAVRDTEGRWVHVDATGVSLNGRYEAAGPMWQGQRFVVEDGLPQFVDAKGRQTLAATRAGYVEYGILTDGVFAARDTSGAWRFLDQAFRPVLGDATFDEVTSFAGGLAATRTGETWRVVRRDGSVVGEGYGGVAVDAEGVLVSQGRFFAKVGDSFQMFSSDGERVGDGTYEDARPFDVRGAAAVRVGGLWGFVDASGRVVVEPAFEDARSFAHGLAAVRTGGAWGYVDETGTLVIPAVFLDATRFTASGTALVLTDGASKPAVLTDATATTPPDVTTSDATATPDATTPDAESTPATTDGPASPPSDGDDAPPAPLPEPTDDASTDGPLLGGSSADDTGWRQIKLLRF